MVPTTSFACRTLHPLRTDNYGTSYLDYQRFPTRTPRATAQPFCNAYDQFCWGCARGPPPPPFGGCSPPSGGLNHSALNNPNQFAWPVPIQTPISETYPGSSFLLLMPVIFMRIYSSTWSFAESHHNTNYLKYPSHLHAYLACYKKLTFFQWAF